MQDIVVFLRIERGVDGGISPYATTLLLALSKSVLLVSEWLGMLTMLQIPGSLPWDRLCHAFISRTSRKESLSAPNRNSEP